MAAVVNGDGQAVLPPGVLSPVTRYRQPERDRGAWQRRRAHALRAARALRRRGRSASPAGPTCGRSRASRRHAGGPVKIAAEAARRRRSRQAAPTNALVIGYDHRPRTGMRLRARTRSCSCAPIRRTRRSPCSPSRVTSSSTGAARTGGHSPAASTPPTPTAARQERSRRCASVTGLQIHFLIGVNFDGFRAERRQARRRLARHRPALLQRQQGGCDSTRRSTSGPATSASRAGRRSTSSASGTPTRTSTGSPGSSSSSRR